MLAQLLADPPTAAVQLLGAGLMLLNAIAAGWLVVRPLRHARSEAAEGERTAP